MATSTTLIDQRRAENEDSFRTANEHIERAAAVAGATSSQGFLMHCECADLDCEGTIDLTIEQYEAVRAHPRHFAVVDGHEDGADRVLQRVDGHTLVEKTGIEGRVTASLDERSREVDLRQRAERIARNESVYREVNDRIVGSKLSSGSAFVEIACECGDLHCAQLLRVRVDDYEAVRQVPTRFMIARGHRVPDTEVLVHRRADMEVVEKIGVGARRAQELSSET